MIEFLFFGMPIKTLGSLGKIRVGRVTGNTHFFFGLMRKPAFCICKNKYADQLRSNCAADQHLSFRFMDNTIPVFYLNPKFQASRHLLWPSSPVCVGPGRKPLRPVFSQRGSYGNQQVTLVVIPSASFEGIGQSFFIFRFTGSFCKKGCREGGIKIKMKYPKWVSR